MKLETVIGWTDAEQTAIRAVFNGQEMTVPDDPRNRHRAIIAEWEAEGDTIPPYQEPQKTQAELDEANRISSVRFNYMLAINGWEKVWSDIEEFLSQQEDKTLYARLFAQKSATFYRLSVTLKFLEGVKSYVSQLHPNVDLSETTVRKAWEEAKVAEIV